AHTTTSAPSSRSCTANPSSGSTSPRDPYVDNNTRISRLPFPQVLISVGDFAAQRGSCRKPPSAIYVEVGRSGSPSFCRPVGCRVTTAPGEHRSRVSAYGIAVDDGRLLVVRLADSSPIFEPGLWHLPGGGIDPGEQPAESLAREFAEETGLTLRAAELVD